MKKIGWDGKSLKEMLIESQGLTKKTSHYYGITELKLKEEDPLKFERFKAGIRGALMGARETFRYTTASPGTRELGEYLYLLLTPEGDTIDASTGLMGHIFIAGDFIKWLIMSEYESDPGIKPGDIIVDNDPKLGGTHPADVKTYVPIFWEGELVSWAAGVIHEIDVGGQIPGMHITPAIELFGDGHRFCAFKAGENDNLRKDFILTVTRNSRMGHLWALDEKARAAGCIYIRDRIIELLKEYGVKYFKRAIREIIEEGRRICERRIKERMVPGRYRNVTFLPLLYKGMGLPPHADKNQIIHMPLELTVTSEGKIKFDHEGCSRWGWHPYNNYPAAWKTFCGLSMITFFLYEGANYGADIQLESNLPEGSVLNPDYDFAATSIYPGISVMLGAHNSLLYSIGFYSKGYLEEIMGGGLSAWHGIDIGGIDERGKSFGFCHFELSSLGSGAKAVDDGIDAGHCGFNTESDHGNAEIWELVHPWMTYIGRGLLKNSCGHGKFRGGSGWQSIFYVSNPPKVLTFSESGTVPGVMSYETMGLFGGYPAPGYMSILLRNTNLRELAEKGVEIPSTIEGLLELVEKGILKAEEILIRKSQANVTELKDGDILAVTYGGGAGYGDPIERDPEKVKEDIVKNIISIKIAENVYGVKLKKLEDGRLEIDEEKTEKLREEIKKKRGERAIPVKEWWKKERERVLNMEMPPEVKEMLKECMDISEKFKKEYKVFWGLPDNHSLLGYE